MAERRSKSGGSATERVEQHIRQSIYTGALKPRERVIEEDLAKQLDCSRGPVREALLRLERDGLIVSLPRRGTFIRDISAESIEVIFSMRAKLEALCVRYLRQDSPPEAEASLKAALAEMKAAAKNSNEERFLQADMALHRTIWKLSNREQLYLTLNTVMNPFIFMVARAFSSRAPIRQRYKNHEAYVEMLLSTPISEVESAVEDYFHTLFVNLQIQIQSPFLIPPNGAAANLPTVSKP
jgi:DNA-binding GntR family transcriptional regulator